MIWKTLQTFAKQHLWDMSILQCIFLTSSLGVPQGLNTADKVAVRDQNNSEAPHDFTVLHY